MMIIIISIYVKMKIDKMQQNSKRCLCDDREETINHMISEYDKRVKKSTRLDTTE